MGGQLSCSKCVNAPCLADERSCDRAIVRHILETEAPFRPVDLANCQLLRASKDGDIASIQEALEAGANINTRLAVWISLGSTDDDENEPPDEVIEWSDSGPVKRPTTGLTPLMYASYEGHVEAVKHLILHGAKLYQRDEDGMQAIHLAAKAGSAECFIALLEAGADPLVKDYSELDALQYLPLAMISQESSKKEWLAAWERAKKAGPEAVAAAGWATAAQDFVTKEE